MPAALRQRRITPSLYAQLCVGSCVLFFVWLCLPGRGAHARQLVSTASFVLAPAVGAWRCWRAGQRGGAWRRTWLLTSVALVVWGLASGVWGYEAAVDGGNPPFPSPADGGYLLFPVLGVGALLALPVMPHRATPAARLLLDAVSTTAAMLLLARLGPLDGSIGRHVHGIGHWVITAYPSLDVLAGSVVVVVLDRLRAGPRHPGVMLAAGLAAACGGDLAYALLSTHHAYTAGGPLDIVWAASFLLVGGAAGRPLPVDRVSPAAVHRVLPTLPAALAIVALVVSGRLASGMDPLLILLGVVLSAALGARQHLLTAENRALHASLEQRVAQRTAELRQAREVFRQRAYTDPLTGLANRDAFHEALAVAAASMDGGCVAVVLIDLDGFKEVNDSFGHEAGDEVLVAVAERLSGCLRRAGGGQPDVTRIGGDEFACLLRGLDGPEGADRVAERLVAAMRESVVIRGREFFLGASAGVAVATAPMVCAPGELLREADTAMYVAKDEGGNRYRTFDSRMHRAVVERVALEADLHRALADGDIRVEYQPVIAIGENRITGVEALARWRHPVRGNVSPIDFIALAERNGLIVELERQVLEQVGEQMSRWRQLVPDLKLGVNFSPRHLREPGMVASVLDCLARYDLPASSLVAEVTESLFFADEDVVGEVLREMHAAGIVLALDDFGTGYSSLSRLSAYPFSILKVDRSFLAEIGKAARPPTILLATLAIAVGLGLDVVAEGVETVAQLDFLRQHGCPYAQGYLLAQPTAAHNIERMLRLPSPV